MTDDEVDISRTKVEQTAYLMHYLNAGDLADKRTREDFSKILLALRNELDRAEQRTLKAEQARNLAIKEMCDQAREAGMWQGIAEGKDIIIRQLESEIATTRALMVPQWQPIETAPKDALEVWAFNGEQARMVWDWDCGSWLWSDALLNDADPMPEQPTHWMPLPASPMPEQEADHG